MSTPSDEMRREANERVMVAQRVLIETLENVTGAVAVVNHGIQEGGTLVVLSTTLKKQFAEFEAAVAGRAALG